MAMLHSIAVTFCPYVPHFVNPKGICMEQDRLGTLLVHLLQCYLACG